MRALWSDVRTLETKMVARETNEESIFRAIITWSGTVTRPQTGPAAAAPEAAPKKIAKPRPERTRVLRDPSPCIVRGSSEVAEAAF